MARTTYLPAGQAWRMPAPRPPRRRRQGRGWWQRLLLALGVLLLLALGGAGYALWATVPAATAEVAIPGLTAPVTITLDAKGIPRIRAGNELDGYAALGWLHARDRLFQMELTRRGAAGRLAEIAGPALLRSDRLVRTLGLARRAEADLATLPEETQAVLAAYARGVNAWIDAEGRFAAPEFLALGKPEPWLPEHSLLWGKVMGLWLSHNYRDELQRVRLGALLPPERVLALWPVDGSAGRPDWPFAAPPPRPPEPEPEAEATPGRQGAAEPNQVDPALAARLAALLPSFPEPFTLPDSASNSWAVAGSRSQSGQPLLANDPHLGFSAPVLWYLARIDLPGGQFLAGATSPGVPFMIVGRNARLAWGFTNNGADVQDLFVEREAGPGRYVTPEGAEAFGVAEERILVRGAEAEALVVRETRHGPVISDLDEVQRGSGAGQVLALAAANLAPGDTAAAGLLALNRAGSVAEARAAAALITSPVQNLIAADVAGGIGLYTTGRVPLRRAGDGSLPAPGHDGSHDWTGWAATEALPATENPDSGVLANGNNRTAPTDFPVFMGRDWYGDWRFRRIGERLEPEAKLGAADMAAIQLDTVSLLAREALGPEGLLRRIPRPEGASAVALDLLLAWDGNMAATLPQPLIFNAWRRQFAGLAQASNGVAPQPGRGLAAWPSELVQSLMRDQAQARLWCRSDCTAMAAQALRQAVEQLQSSQGRDPVAWRWGNVHKASFEHPLLARIPGLGFLGRLEAETGGDGETVNRGGMRGSEGMASFQHVHGPGLRLVADLADPDGTLASIGTGQSGNPLARHWADLLLPWRDGTPVRLSREPESVSGRLRLRP